MTGILVLGASMVLGGVAQMLAPKARTPLDTTDNGKQNTYFSSLDKHGCPGSCWFVR